VKIPETRPLIAHHPSEGVQMLALSLALSIFTALIFALGSLWLLAGGRLDALSARTILALAGGGALLVANASKASKGTFAGWVAFVVLSGLVSHHVIDTSFDGQHYHYDAIRALADGWNPLRQDFILPSELKGTGTPTPWPEHYPKASWLASATWVAAGLDSETAKLPALLLAGALFFGTLGICRRWGLSRWQAMITAVLTTGNPIILVQIFSRMNDGLLACCIGLIVIYCLLFLTRRTFTVGAALTGVLIFALNLKFTALPLLGALSALICLMSLGTDDRTRTFWLGGMLLAAALAGVIVFGAQPYLTNLLRYGHPFFPLMGSHPQDIISSQRPLAFGDLSPLQRLAASLFSPTSTGWDDLHVVLKLPLSVKRGEIWAAGDYDTRLGGFGPLFSAVLVLSMGVAILVLSDRSRSRVSNLLLLFGGALLVISVAMPESWWARFVPELWWAPVLVAIAGLASERPVNHTAAALLVCLIGLNVAMVAKATISRDEARSSAVRRQLVSIAAQDSDIAVAPGECHARLPLLKRFVKRTVEVVRLLPENCQPIELAANFGHQGFPRYCVLPRANLAP
jgi:hypothetical protein